MSVKVFLDTNILVYLYSASEQDKRNKLCQTLNNLHRITSIQALNEASNVWFRKYNWDGTKIKKHLDNIELICDEVRTVTRGTVDSAISLKDTYGYSFYDCLMLASAIESDCREIFTEDMRNGQVINNLLKIINPFTHAGSSS